MEYYLYILLNHTKQHWYIGSTDDLIGSTDDLVDRLRRHNAGQSKSTKPYRPWGIVYTEPYATRSEAVKREMFLKSPAGYQQYKEIKRKFWNGRIA